MAVKESFFFSNLSCCPYIVIGFFFILFPGPSEQPLPGGAEAELHGGAVHELQLPPPGQVQGLREEHLQDGQGPPDRLPQAAEVHRRPRQVQGHQGPGILGKRAPLQASMAVCARSCTLLLLLLLLCCCQCLFFVGGIGHHITFLSTLREFCWDLGCRNEDSLKSARWDDATSV